MGNRFISPMSRAAQVAICTQLAGCGVGLYALFSRQWQVGSGHQLGLWTQCIPGQGCSSVTNDGLTAAQWAGVEYPRILLCVACFLSGASAVPTTIMCTERSVRWQCCGAFFFNLLACALTAAAVLLYLSLAKADYAGQSFGLGILYAIIAAGIMLLSALMLGLSRRLYDKEHRVTPMPY